MWGVDRLSGGHQSATRKRLRNGGCAVLSHAPAIDRRGRTTLEVLNELGVEPRVILSPEHGYYGVAQAEEPVTGQETAEGGPRMVSLYGADSSSLIPDSSIWDGIQTLVIDMVDVGCRYYTYVWSALLAARAAAAVGVHSVVLDRPNPLSGDPVSCEGRLQSPGYTSFVGLEPLPIRHALTIGEILAHFTEMDGGTLGASGSLSVVTCSGWERYQTASAWNRPFVPPSPNMPTLETALLYPGGCLLEGTNLSEGRGTSYPFRVVGAPFLNAEQLCESLRAEQLPGVIFRPMRFRPSFEKHAGQICNGVMLHITDPVAFRPVATYVTLICLAQKLAPEHFQFLTRPYEFVSDRMAFDLLTGGPETRQAIVDNQSPESVVAHLCPVPADYSEFVRAAEARLERAQG